MQEASLQHMIADLQAEMRAVNEQIAAQATLMEENRRLVTENARLVTDNASLKSQLETLRQKPATSNSYASARTPRAN